MSKSSVTERPERSQAPAEQRERRRLAEDLRYDRIGERNCLRFRLNFGTAVQPAGPED